MSRPRVAVVIPAYNEEAAIGMVVADIPSQLVDEIVVVDNGSNDATGSVAAAAGANVVEEPRRGYGQACMRGIAALGPAEIVVFLDGDYSDYAGDMPALLDPIVVAGADLVIGSRTRGGATRGSLTLQQRVGNALATRLIRYLFGVHFTDLGPFRAIRSDALAGLAMEDRDYGWTVEMQVKAAQRGLKCVEVSVRYRQRIGISKISGTLSGSLRAGYKIVWTIIAQILRREKCD